MTIKKIYFVCPKFLYKNEVFNLKSVHNWDNALYPYYLLRRMFSEKGVDLNTYDYFNESEKNYALVFQDFRRDTDNILKKHSGIKKFLIVYESPIKIPENQKKENYRYFEKVFTWNTKLADNQKIFRLNYSRKIPKKLAAGSGSGKKLLTAAFGYKLQTHPLELYTERIRAIRWFEKNRLEDFDLYGYDWNERYFKDKLFHLNKIKILKKILRPNFPSYKGFAKEKKDVYKNYKFALCYENASYTDYITEKIFDCFLAGAVPIYLGAPNIADFIPESAFIDKRKFNTYEELCGFIKNMLDEKYEKYLKEIKSFVESDKIYPFSAECFANTLSEEILKSINGAGSR